MPRPRAAVEFAVGPLAMAFATSCSRQAVDAPSTRTPAEVALVSDAAHDAATLPESGSPPETSNDSAVDVAEERPPSVPDGPHFLTLEPGRTIYYALPGARSPASTLRLIVSLHGTCGGPEYACGPWLHAATEVGAVVCPTGNAHCGPSPLSPPTWEAPSWGELVRDMDDDVERSVARVMAHHPHVIDRRGAILSGYSRGGYAVPFIASRHPGRWPLLLVIEADATLDASSLRRAGVRAAALVAGELGDQIAGMRKTTESLDAASFPARLFVMPKTGHLFSENMDDVMREALTFLVAEQDAGGSAP